MYVSEKRVRRYCEKIGLDFDQVPQLLEQQKIKEEPAIKIKLKAIETIVDCHDPKVGRKELKKIEIPSHCYELLAYYYYILGKSLIPNQSKAEKAFFRSIEIIDEHPELKTTNLQAACYYELGRCAFLQNDLKQALQYTESGLAAFVKKEEAEKNKTERLHVEFLLLITRVIYARRLGKDGVAKQTLQNMWKRATEASTEIQLNMAVEQAQLYNKEQMYELAIETILPYIDLARRERKYDRLMELWSILGTTYKQMGDFKQAKSCLKAAEKLESKVNNKAFTGHTYIELGRLFLAEGETTPAKKLIEKGIKLCKKDIIKYIYGLYSLAECYEQESPKEAIALYEKALEITKEYQLEKQQQKILLRLAMATEQTNVVKYNRYLEAYYQISVNLEHQQRGGQPLKHSVLTLRNRSGDPPIS